MKKSGQFMKKTKKYLNNEENMLTDAIDRAILYDCISIGKMRILGLPAGLPEGKKSGGSGGGKYALFGRTGQE